MEISLQVLSILLCFLCRVSADQTLKSYVVYMGNPTSNVAEDNVEALELAHLAFLSSILPSEKRERERSPLIHVYNHAFKGFTAKLTEEEASVLSEHDEVISVFPDPILQLHTTRSWDFLKAESGVRFAKRYLATSTHDVIIGVIDTGIWPEHPSFRDDDMGKIPSRWRGVCMESSNFKKSNCNKKLIGARYYSVPDNETKPTISPRDERGHGTHTASTAAGAIVANASYFGLGKGTARGGSPSSRIAVYNACTVSSCPGATVLKAIDDAIKDGVDIISISIGVNSIFQKDYFKDPMAIGAFHANQKGIMVVCSAGNDGPALSTVVNTSPWMFTVAASSIDRDFKSTVILGNGHALKGSAINFSNLTASKLYPLAYGGDIAAPSTPLSESSNCAPGSLDTRKVAGKIIVCLQTNPSLTRRITKLVVEDAQAKGVILIDEEGKGIPFNSGVFPLTIVGNGDGNHILNYIKSTNRIYITAPGVGILAAMIPITEQGIIPPGKKPSLFGVQSGTSMACPHVTGAAAFLKSIHPHWSPSMIKSALMTTAIVSDNTGKPISNSSEAISSPHERGAGEIIPIKAISPGLVYETTTTDYLYFLCYYGYKKKTIQTVFGSNFTCPKTSTKDFISDINYPSISISNLQGRRGSRTIARTVTNVGPKNSTYVAKVDAPKGLEIGVVPNRLCFSRGTIRASYKVSFLNKGATKGYKFGSISWSDGRHFVRTNFAVNVV